MTPRRGDAVEERREGEAADLGGKISGIDGKLAAMEERFNSLEEKVEANLSAMKEIHRESMEALQHVLKSWGKERENPNPNPKGNLEEAVEATGGATQALVFNKGTLEALPEEEGGVRPGEGDSRPVEPWAGPWEEEGEEEKEGHGRGWGRHALHGGEGGRRRGRDPWEEGGRGGGRDQGRWGRTLDPHGQGGWEGYGPRGGGPRARGNGIWGGAGGREGRGGRTRDPRGYGERDPRDGEPWGEPWAREGWEGGGHGAGGWREGGRGGGPTGKGLGPYGQGARGVGRLCNGREPGKEEEGTLGTHGKIKVLMNGRKEAPGGGSKVVGTVWGKEGRTAERGGAHPPSVGRKGSIGKGGRGEGQPWEERKTLAGEGAGDRMITQVGWDHGEGKGIMAEEGRGG